MTTRPRSCDVTSISKRCLKTFRGAGLRRPFYWFNPVYALARRYYHLWFYNSRVWEQTTWMGVPTLKSPMDMWNYQEILVALRPSLIVEFGTAYGGSALFFAAVMRQFGNPFAVVSVDIEPSKIAEKAKADPAIRFLTMSSDGEEAQKAILSLTEQFPGPIFAILDSDHSKSHVLAEMMNLRPVLAPGDYLVVEDSNVNGHPVRPFFGPGPYEAVREYFRRFPNDYERDVERAAKFGFSFAPAGFLRRR